MVCIFIYCKALKLKLIIKLLVSQPEFGFISQDFSVTQGEIKYAFKALTEGSAVNSPTYNINIKITFFIFALLNTNVF